MVSFWRSSAPVHNSITKILSFCIHFIQWQHDLSGLTATLYNYFLKGWNFFYAQRCNRGLLRIKAITAQLHATTAAVAFYFSKSRKALSPTDFTPWRTLMLQCASAVRQTKVGDWWVMTSKPVVGRVSVDLSQKMTLGYILY